MKKILFLISGILSAGVLYSQTNGDDGTVTMIPCTGFEITKPLRELAKEHPYVPVTDTKDKKEAEDRQMRIPYLYVSNPEVEQVDELSFRQTTPGTKQMLTPLVGWNGLSGASYPPDPTGVAGTNYYLQGVNTEYKVYSKTGSSVSSTIQLGTLLYGTSNDGGDPIVLYDKFADRWFVSEFNTSGTKIYIAISQTNDPTGSYYKWQFTTPQFPDFQKFSIWWDGYYMTSNQSSQKIFCFQRDQMILGATSPKAFYKTFSPPTQGSGYFFCQLPADADGQLPASGTPCPIFTYEDDGWGSGHSDRINVYEMTVNWVPTTPTATIAGPTQLASAAFDASYNTSWNDIPQPGTTQKLDGIGGVFNFRAQYRVWPGYNTVVLCMGVKVSSSQRSIRWYELRQTGGTWSIYQQSTYAPSDGLYRWCGSIAMDDNGGIGMAYSISGSSGTYPGIRYTGRAASDPLNQMTYTEQVAQAGSSSQTGGVNRWGDYSHTSLDPVDGTILWHTGEYLTTGGNIATRIFSFQIPLITGVDQAASESDFKVYRSYEKIIVKASGLPSDDELIVDLFDINGRKITGKTITPSALSFETSFDTDGLAKGIYLVRIGKLNTSFQKVSKVAIE